MAEQTALVLPGISAASSIGMQYPALPSVADANPARCVHVADAGGRCEIFATDRSTGRTRQVTRRSWGTTLAAIDPSGTKVWWFDDDHTEVGVWRTQDFRRTGGSGPDEAAFPDVPPGRPAGLAMTRSGATAIGVGTAHGLAVYLDGRLVVRADAHAKLVDLAPDGDLIAVAGDPHGPDAVRLFRPDGTVAATLAGTGPDHTGVWALSFAPTAAALLLILAEHDQYRLATWRPHTGVQPHCTFDTEISASWYPDGERVLVRQDRHARSLLFTAEQGLRTVTPIPTPPGSILEAAVHPDGVVRYIWTDATTPPLLRCAGYDEPPAPDRGVASTSCRREDLWVPGPGGPVHTLLTLPGAKPGPYPTVFLVHGGPHSRDRDAYDAMVEILVSTGCAVARVNYRGSTGYGPAWRNAFAGEVGHAQLQDLAAVRAELIRCGVAAPDTVALCGTSWGGYLTLLALGVQPDLWQAGVAIKPIADYAAAFRAGTEAVRALDVSLFGGTPDEVPERYAKASPTSYAAQVRSPVLIVAARWDTKCPAEQIEIYTEALREHAAPHELHWVASGHDGFDSRSHVTTLQTMLRFLHGHLHGAQVEVHVGPG